MAVSRKLLHAIHGIFRRERGISRVEVRRGSSAAKEDMERFQKQYPGAYFDIENVSMHHQVALFKWVLVMPDGNVTVKGHDCIRFSPAGKIMSLLTFGPASPKA